MAKLIIDLPGLSKEDLAKLDFKKLTGDVTIGFSSCECDGECDCGEQEVLPVHAITDGKTMTSVIFSDGETVTTHVKQGKEFHLYEGIKKCCLKKYLGPKYVSMLTYIYDHVGITDNDDEDEDEPILESPF